MHELLKPEAKVTLPDVVGMKSVTLPIDPSNMPKCIVYEADGASWRAVEDGGVRWIAENSVAKRKGQPTGEMSEIPPNFALSKTDGNRVSG